MNEEVLDEIERLQVTRICHFTPLRNLVHIATGAGLLSTRALIEAERKAFTAQDISRWDGHPDHISCSIEYPNAWYYRQKIGNDQIFRTWVVVTIVPQHLANDATRFCHRNASAAHGAYIRDGIEGFRGLYENQVEGSGGNIYRRTETHIRQCPTDNQAEALVPRFIPIEDVVTIALPTPAQAAFVYAGLEQIGGSPERFTFAVVPEFFEPHALKSAISGGVRPSEEIWAP
jgi:hypothetical protein